MKKLLTVLVLMCSFMMNTACSQNDVAFADVNVDERTEVKTSNKTVSEEARLLEILKRDYQKEFGRPISKWTLDRTTILVNTKFENDGFLEFWWELSFPSKKNGRNYVEYVKHKYQYDKIEDVVKTRSRSVEWNEYLD